MQAWPREERVLTVAERYELQQLLGQRGFDIGEPDGRIGPRTRIAIRNFQVATGQIPGRVPFEPRARPFAPAMTAQFCRTSGGRFANDAAILKLTFFG